MSKKERILERKREERERRASAGGMDPVERAGIWVESLGDDDGLVRMIDGNPMLVAGAIACVVGAVFGPLFAWADTVSLVGSAAFYVGAHSVATHRQARANAKAVTFFYVCVIIIITGCYFGSELDAMLREDRKLARRRAAEDAEREERLAKRAEKKRLKKMQEAQRKS
jgi:hypothetical protein